MLHVAALRRARIVPARLATSAGASPTLQIRSAWTRNGSKVQRPAGFSGGNAVGRISSQLEHREKDPVRAGGFFGLDAREPPPAPPANGQVRSAEGSWVLSAPALDRAISIA